MIDWLLVDYGETISTPLPARTVRELADLAGQNPAEFLRRWHARPDYDLGQAPEIYWSRVLDRGPSDLSPLIDALTRIDVHGWLSVNASTLRTPRAHARRIGTRLALLSNAPEPLAAAIDRSSWSRHVIHRFYSWGWAAPNPIPRHSPPPSPGSAPTRTGCSSSMTGPPTPSPPTEPAWPPSTSVPPLRSPGTSDVIDRV